MMVIKKNIIITTLSILYIIFVCNICFPDEFESSNGTEIFLSAKLPDTEISYKRIITNGLISIEAPTTFNIKALVEPIKYSKYKIVKEKKIEIDNPKIFCSSNMSRMKYAFNLRNNPISILDYPILKIEWNDTGIDKEPNIFINADITTKSNKKKKVVSISNNNNPFQVIDATKTIDMKKVAYTPTTYKYLLSREIGYKSDDKWRFRSKEGRTILQTRLDLDLNKSCSIRMMVDKNIPIDLIQFSIDSNGDGKRDKFILMDKIKINKKLENSIYIYNVNLVDIIDKLKIDMEKAVLMEPIIFINMNPNEYFKQKAFFKIIIGKHNANYNTNEIDLEKYKKGTSKVIEYDFHKMVENKNLENAQIDNLTISIEQKSPQAVNINEITFIDKSEYRVPLIYKKIDDSLESWGVDEKKINSNYNKIIQEYRPIFYSNSETNNSIENFKKDYVKDNYVDSQIEITGNKVWYNLHKKNNTININGVFSSEQSQLVLKLYPSNKEENFIINKNINVKVKLKSHNNEGIDLNINKFFEFGQFTLQRNNEIEITLNPDNKKNKGEGFEKQDKFYFSIAFGKDIKFKEVNYPKSSIDNKNVKWLSDNNIIKGNILALFNGENYIKGNIILENSGEIIKLPINIRKGEYVLFPKMKSMSKFVGFEADDIYSTISENTFYEIILFDIVIDSYKQKMGYRNSEYWVKDDDLFFIPKENNTKIDYDNKSIYLFSNKENNSWNFCLHNPDILYARKIILPNLDYRYFDIQVKINNKDIITKHEQNEIDLCGFKNKIFDINILVEYRGIEPILKINMPILKVVGSRRSLIEDERIKILFNNNTSSEILSNNIENIDNKVIPFGSINFEKGDYFINVTNNKYFKTKRIYFDTNSIFTNIIEENIKNKSYRILTLIKRILYLILFSLLLGSIIKFHKNVVFILNTIMRNISSLLICLNNFYWSLSDNKWLLIWIILLITLIYVKFISIYSVKFDIGYIALTLLMIYWHFIRIIKKKIIANFDTLSKIFYYRESTPFFINACANLIITVTVLLSKREKIAEFVSVLIYFNLFIAVLMDIKYLKKGSKG